MFLLSHAQIQRLLLQTAFRAVPVEEAPLAACLGEVSLLQDKDMTLGNQANLKDTRQAIRGTKGRSSHHFNETFRHRANGQIQAPAECQMDHRRWEGCLSNGPRELYQTEPQAVHQAVQ